MNVCLLKYTEKLSTFLIVDFLIANYSRFILSHCFNLLPCSEEIRGIDGFSTVVIVKLDYEGVFAVKRINGVGSFRDMAQDLVIKKFKSLGFSILGV